MALQNQLPVNNMNTLALEKNRLMEECRSYKTLMNEQLQHLKEHSPEMLVKGMLPFRNRTRDQVYKGLKWTGITVTKYIGTPAFIASEVASGRAGRILPMAGLHVALNIYRNIISKRKQNKELPPTIES
ncbi:MAG: hypothetical protein H0V61_00200 [Chitinophagales bacterium]|nr:hypothetical protein [Chitinophagales bacterium]